MLYSDFLIHFKLDSTDNGYESFIALYTLHKERTQILKRKRDLETCSQRIVFIIEATQSRRIR